MQSLAFNAHNDYALHDSKLYYNEKNKRKSSDIGPMKPVNGSGYKKTRHVGRDAKSNVGTVISATFISCYERT